MSQINVQLERAINPAQQDLLLTFARVETSAQPNAGDGSDSDPVPQGAADAPPAPGQPRAATRQPPRRRGGFVKNW